MSWTPKALECGIHAAKNQRLVYFILDEPRLSNVGQAK